MKRQVLSSFINSVCFGLGFGVFALEEFKEGDFLLQYCGDKITEQEAQERMTKDSENKFFFYNYEGQKWW